MPPFEDIVRAGYHVQLSQVHEVRVEDLLGRRPVQTDLSAIAGYVSGKTVLITGAGGSIGSELARQVHRFGPSELVLLDRDESGLHGVQLSIYGQGLLDSRDMVLADIREADVLDRVFSEHKPEVVFHAAALKHLPMLEQYPEEGWKTNVLGTLNVLEAARRHGVRHFVNISTDKAADATSVLGKTKRAAEELTAWFAAEGAGTYLSVRFGNVLGSRGSMLHTFTAQIERGGPITVTHPDITRFFMTIPEACELVIQAGAIGDPGDVLVLDMGTPIKILDVATRLIAHSGRRDVEVVFTGLRPGEKLHEVLFSENEAGEPSGHPLISHVQVPPLHPRDVRTDVRSLVSINWDELSV
ncbi:MAG: polysaccharide biosynthesis protein [Actinobacteria bacterium]|nr:polysaccharide biosynthesis protein [Actinomycetota bacterium]